MNYLSNYNQYVNRDNNTFVYNILTGNAIRFEDYNTNEVKAFLKEADDNELQDFGFINESGYENEEIKLWYNSMKYSRKTLNVMLIMTYKCNCACEYCFEKLDSNFGIVNEQDFEKSVNYMIDHYKKGNFEELELSFFGGEPLLETKKIEYVMLKLKENNVKVKPIVITNGVLLNDEVINTLKVVGVQNYQITIDGPKEIHDIRRPCKNGDSCWDSIMKNLEILLDNEIGVSVRINIDEENINALSEICEKLPKRIIERDNCCIYIAPIVGCETNNVQKLLKQRAQNLIKAWKIIDRDNLPIQINLPVYAPCPYHSLDSAFYLDLKGNIYTCGGFVGDKAKLDFVNYNRTKNFYERMNYTPRENCFKCSFFPVCMGGCQFETHVLKENCQIKYLKAVYDEYYTKYAK